MVVPGATRVGGGNGAAGSIANLDDEGGTAVDAAAALPENAKIIATIEEEKKGDATYRYYQWQRIPGAPHPNHFGFIDVQHADQHGRSDWVLNAPQQRAYLAHPATKTGAFLTYADASGNPYQPFDIPGGWPAGKYTIRVRIAATADTPKSRHFVEFGPGGGAVVSTPDYRVESPGFESCRQL